MRTAQDVARRADRRSVRLVVPGRATAPDPVHVMHLVDSLDIGGAERMSVNLVNALPRGRYRLSLCTTRHDGPLADHIAADVSRLRLDRTRRFDLDACRRLIRYVRDERVSVLHAHGTSLFLAQVAARWVPGTRIVWHDHFGRYAVAERSAWLYRQATAGIGAVIAVNTPLAQWARRALRFPADRVWYVPNFVLPDDATSLAAPDLPGCPQTRIACVANLRRQKDHLTLVEAMAQVAREVPSAHLVLAGDTPDAAYLRDVRAAIEGRGLTQHVTILGPRRDVGAILRASAVGVLSSASEGLPLALIEYGMAGLATVATDVGECAAVLDGGRAGLLVPPQRPDALAGALLRLLQSTELRIGLAGRLGTHVRKTYGEGQGVRRVSQIYDAVLDQR